MSCKINIPNIATKRLKLQRFSDNKRKLIVSTNWLPLFGFEQGSEIVEELRDITHTSSWKNGIEKGRSRHITRDTILSPTFTKSEERMAKDSVYVIDSVRNKTYFPSNELMGLNKENINFDAVGKVIASEIIGQGIDTSAHNYILEAIKEHILSAHAKLNNRLF